MQVENKMFSMPKELFQDHLIFSVHFHSKRAEGKLRKTEEIIPHIC
jgi:hypothetical protein